MTEATLIKDNYHPIHYHQGRKHGSIQEGMALEELRVLHLVPKPNRSRLGGRSFKVYLHSDILPPTRSYLLIVPLPGPNILKPLTTVSITIFVFFSVAMKKFQSKSIEGKKALFIWLTGYSIRLQLGQKLKAGLWKEKNKTDYGGTLLIGLFSWLIFL
jgi:hypothetical protein